MEFRRDDRGVTVQIGAVLLFGILIIALATFQATVVPAENAEIEYKHNLGLQTDMLNLRGGLLEAGRTGRTTATTVRMGTTYPTRVLFVNPPPPSGTIQTVGTNDDAVNITISGAIATDPDAKAYLNGSNKSFQTGAVIYYPGYNEYRSAPQTGIDTGTGVVFNSQGNTTVPLTSQSLVDGNRINLVLVTGNLSRSGSLGTAIDARAASSSENTVRVKGPINIIFATRLDPARWENQSEELLGGQEHVEDVRPAGTVDGGWNLVTVELEANTTYELSISKVGFGAVGSTSGTGPAYITATDDEVVVNEKTNRTIRFELRDELSNPTGGANVTVSLAPGDHGNLRYDGTTGDSVQVPASDHDGEILVKYVATDVNGSSTANATVTASFSGAVNADAGNATTNVTVVNTDGSGTSSGGSGDETSADQVNLSTNGTTAGGGGSKVEFEVSNDGSSSATIVGIAINNTTSSASSVGGGDDVLFADGNPVVSEAIPIDNDPNGERQNFDPDVNIPAGGEVAFRFDKFKSKSGGAGGAVDMSGETIWVTFYLQDGSQATFKLEVSA